MIILSFFSLIMQLVSPHRMICEFCSWIEKKNKALIKVNVCEETIVSNIEMNQIHQHLYELFVLTGKMQKHLRITKVNYPNEQPKKEFIFCLAVSLKNRKSSKLAFLCTEGNLQSLKMTKPTLFQPHQGSFGFQQPW